MFATVFEAECGAGDKRTEPQQLFRLNVVLDANSRVAFAPSLQQLTDMINACSKAIINMLQVSEAVSSGRRGMQLTVWIRMFCPGGASAQGLGGAGGA